MNLDSWPWPLSPIVEVAAELLVGGAGLGGTMVNAENHPDAVGVAVALMARLRRHLPCWQPEGATG